MSQVNVNSPGPAGPPNTSGDSAVAAGINLMTVIIIVAVIVVVLIFLWWLVTSSGLLGGATAPVAPAPQAPAAPAAPKKAGDILPFITAFL